MQLKIDRKPKLYSLEFVTLQAQYAESTSPRSIITQSGMEFDHFRQYQPSDDARQIDWVASARTSELLVRVFTENTSVNILFMLDVSESMIYGTGKKAKIEYAIEMLISMIYGILNYGDSVGLLLFNQKVVKYIPYRVGLPYFPEFETALLDAEQFGGPLDLTFPLAFSLDMFKETHLMIFVSDFLGFGNRLYDQINSVADNFDILGIMVYDKSDMSLNRESPTLGLQDPYSPEHRFLNVKKVMKRYEEENKRRVADLRNFFSVIGKDLWLMSTEDSIQKKIPQLLARRNTMRA